MNAGQDLQKAVRECGNERMLVKLTTAINPNNALATGVRYNMRCWAENVRTVPRKSTGKCLTQVSFSLSMNLCVQLTKLKVQGHTSGRS